MFARMAKDGHDAGVSVCWKVRAVGGGGGGSIAAVRELLWNGGRVISLGELFA